jgi:hypothetical protein
MVYEEEKRRMKEAAEKALVAKRTYDAAVVNVNLVFKKSPKAFALIGINLITSVYYEKDWNKILAILKAADKTNAIYLSYQSAAQSALNARKLLEDAIKKSEAANQAYKDCLKKSGK